MARNTYRNGDPISLLCGCNGCNPSIVNGVLCHERGCPDAWRDQSVECCECGCEFFPAERHQRVCEECLNPPTEDDPDWVGNPPLDEGD